MGIPKVVVGRLLDGRLIFKPVAISKTTDWLKWLDSGQLPPPKGRSLPEK